MEENEDKTTTTGYDPYNIFLIFNAHQCLCLSSMLFQIFLKTLNACPVKILDVV